MRIALLGTDANTIAIAREALREGQHEIILAADLGADAATIKKLAPRAQVTDDWQQVLGGHNVEAVVVAADKPTARVDQLRQLLQAEMPVLVSHPLILSMLDCYELDMIRRETGGVIVPYLPARRHPAVDELESFLVQWDSSAIGAIEQFSIERFLAKRDRDAVLRQFSCDADLLQSLAGDATRLHALGSSAGMEGPYANLVVQMTCGQQNVARWSVSPIEQEAGGRLSLVGSRGKAVLWMPENGTTWRLDIHQAGNVSSRDIEGPTAPGLALEQLATAVDGVAIQPDWTDAARTVELAETIDRSLARGRTIDLHNEEFSDIGTFKGTMASIGCGLLLAGLLVVVLAAVVRTIAVEFGFKKLANVLSIWPYALLAVLGVYLLLQLLVFVGKAPDRRKSDAEESNQDSP